MKLIEIEDEFNFKYPELYKKIEEDGMLDVGENGPNWYSSAFQILKENPTILLHSYDFELLNINGIREALDELTATDDYRQISDEFKFIPFGQSGAGDHYCFFITEQNAKDIPIVLLWHDSGEAEYLTKNFQDFIFKAILTDMSEQDTYNKIDDEEFKKNIKNVLKTHLKYLNEIQTEILQNIFEKKIVDYEILLINGRKEIQRGLLSDIELQKIISETITYDNMNLTFKYSK